MNLRQLSYWLAVVDERSFTRAAQRMRVAQPSLSQQIRALEAELGGSLLERLPRTVRLTPAGRAFLAEARLAVQGADRAGRAARAALRLESGDLEIATVRSIAVGLLPASVLRWHERFPEVKIRLHEYAHRDTLEQQVAAGFGDIGVGPPPRDWQGPVELLGWEEFVVVLPKDDPLVNGHKRIALSALAERKWVLFQNEHGLAALIHEICAKWGFMPEPAVETSQVEAACRLAAAGLGPALVPSNVVPSDLEANVMSADPPVGRELTAYARSDWSPSALAYLSVLREGHWVNSPVECQMTR